MLFLNREWGVFVALILAGLVLPVSAQEPEGGFRLKYVPDIGLPIYTGVPTDTAEVAFKKEPNFQGHRVVRNILAGAKGESTALYFAADLNANKLYVDLNRNLDLTDDPQGVFCGTGKYPDKYVGMSFNKITLTVPQQGKAVTYQLSTTYNTFRRGVPSIEVDFLSGWAGKVTLAGKDYLVALLDRPDGTLGTSGRFFIDEWADDIDIQELEARLYGSVPGIPHRLFLQGVYYELGYAYVPGEAGSTDLMFTAKPTEVPMGTLVFEGKNIRHVVLRDKERGPVCLILNHPGSQVDVPVGNYEIESVILAGGDQDKYHLRSGPSLKCVVTTDPPTPVKVGAPLKQEITATCGWHTICLYLKYSGLAGETYVVTQKELPDPPSCTVSKNGQAIANCKFSYG